MLGFDPDQSFVVPDGVYEHMSRREDGAQLEADWQARFDRWRESFAELAEDWDRAQAGELVDGWEAALPTFDPEQKAKLATRAAGASVMEAFKPFTPTMVGGAADLVESTKTAFDGAGMFSRALRRPQHPVRSARARAWARSSTASPSTAAS